MSVAANGNHTSSEESLDPHHGGSLFSETLGSTQHRLDRLGQLSNSRRCNLKKAERNIKHIRFFITTV